MSKDSSSKKPGMACPSTYKTFSLAIQALVALEKNSGKCPSADIAAYLDSDPTALRRILKTLSNEKILESREGRDGGYYLAKSAASITLAEIYTALHIHRAITDSMLDVAKQNCNGGRMKNVFSDILSEVEESTLKVLKAYTIADMAERTN